MRIVLGMASFLKITENTSGYLDNQVNKNISVIDIVKSEFTLQQVKAETN